MLTRRPTHRDWTAPEPEVMAGAYCAVHRDNVVDLRAMNWRLANYQRAKERDQNNGETAR